MAEIYKVQEGESAGEFPAMIRVIRICRNCGAKIFSDVVNSNGVIFDCRMPRNIFEAKVGIAVAQAIVVSAILL